jgi:hypothetical protein
VISPGLAARAHWGGVGQQGSRYAGDAGWSNPLDISGAGRLTWNGCHHFALVPAVGRDVIQFGARRCGKRFGAALGQAGWRRGVVAPQSGQTAPRWLAERGVGATWRGTYRR